MEEYNVKKTFLAAAALLFVIGSFGTDASAQGLLGKGYMGVSLGQFISGEDVIKNADDGVMVFGIEGNYPVLKNLDVFASGSYSKLDGAAEGETLRVTVKTREVWAGATFHFLPETALDPFVKAAVGYVGYNRSNPYFNNDYTKTFGKDGTENKFGFSIAAGVDVPFAGQFSARPAVAYKLIDDMDDFGTTIDFTGFFNKNFFAGMNVGYWVDKGDLTYGTMLGFAY